MSIIAVTQRGYAVVWPFLTIAWLTFAIAEIVMVLAYMPGLSMVYGFAVDYSILSITRHGLVVVRIGFQKGFVSPYPDFFLSHCQKENRY